MKDIHRLSPSVETLEDLRNVLGAYSDFHKEVKEAVIGLPDHKLERKLWTLINKLENKLNT